MKMGTTRGNKFHGYRISNSSDRLNWSMQVSAGSSTSPIQEPDKMQSNSRSANVQAYKSQQTTVQEQANTTPVKRRIPVESLLPVILPQLDKDKAMQLEAAYNKLRRNEVGKDSFVRSMRGLVGEEMLKRAVSQLQSKSPPMAHAAASQLQPQSAVKKHGILRRNLPKKLKHDKLAESALMKRVQQLLDTLTTIATQPRSTLETPAGTADLIEATQQLKEFLELGRADALSPLGEIKLTAVSALAEKTQNTPDIPFPARALVLQLVHDVRFVIYGTRTLSSRRRSNNAMLTRQRELEAKANAQQKSMEETVNELTVERSVISSLQAQLNDLQRQLTDREMRAEAKVRTLTAAADEMEKIVKDYSEVRQIDCLAEAQKLDEEDAHLKAEWERVQRQTDELLSTYCKNPK